MKKKLFEQFSKLKQKFEGSSSANDESKSKKKENKNAMDTLMSELGDNKSTIDPDKITSLDYYYTPNESHDNPIILVGVVAFHHKKGSIVEFQYPSKEEVVKIHHDYLTSISNIEPEQTIDDILNQLTYFCLPDAVHTTNEDAQFFLIQNYKSLLYGISCYKQIKTNSVEVDDQNTRACVQKAICIVSKLPLFGQFFSKLSSTISAFFDQTTLKDKQILEQLYANYEAISFKNININEIFMSFSLRKLFMFCKEKIFTLLKLIMLEKRIVVYSHVSNKICSFILSLVSLIPGNSLFNLNIGSSVKNFMKAINMLGLPLRVFNTEYKIFPLFTLFDFHMTEGLKGFIIGTTNQMVVGHNKLKNDVIINLDTGKILISNDIPEKLLKMSKEEKNVYNKIYNKIKSNYNDATEDWLINMSYSETIFDGSDDFIRNEFKNYFYELLISTDLLIEIIHSTNKDEESFNLIVDSNNESEGSEEEDEEQIEKKKSISSLII
jgi:hypothetical protein